MDRHGGCGSVFVAIHDRGVDGFMLCLRASRVVFVMHCPVRVHLEKAAHHLQLIDQQTVTTRHRQTVVEFSIGFGERGQVASICHVVKSLAHCVEIFRLVPGRRESGHVDFEARSPLQEFAGALAPDE